MSTIEQIYAAQLKAQNEKLAQDHAAAEENLNYQKDQNQKATDANLNRTAVEAQKATVNQTELHNASGLSSGARAQARLSQENQLQADMTALRVAQQESDAMIERQRGILAQEYASAIRQAQAENDLAKATALYEEAQRQDEIRRQQELAAAQLMAQGGDYSRISKFYNLTPEETAALQTAATQAAQGSGLTYEQAWDWYKETADPSLLYGMVPDEVYWRLEGALQETDRVKQLEEVAWSTYELWINQDDAISVLAPQKTIFAVDKMIEDNGWTLTKGEQEALYRYIREQVYKMQPKQEEQSTQDRPPFTSESKTPWGVVGDYKNYKSMYM